MDNPNVNHKIVIGSFNVEENELEFESSLHALKSCVKDGQPLKRIPVTGVSGATRCLHRALHSSSLP